MKYKLLLVLLISLGTHAGEKDGTGGDPLVVEFFQRALFALNTFRLTDPFPLSVIDRYQWAWNDMRVDITDDDLDTTGRVLPDPTRPGKKYVLLDRKKFTEILKSPQINEVCTFAAHETLSTIGMDLQYEYTKYAVLDENEYQRWRVKYKLPSVSTNPHNRFVAVSYSFISGRSAVSVSSDTREIAEANAHKNCGFYDCQTIAWARNQCLALARPANGPITVVSWAFSISRETAKKDAVVECEKKDYGVCQALRAMCTHSGQP